MLFNSPLRVLPTVSTDQTARKGHVQCPAVVEIAEEHGKNRATPYEPKFETHVDMRTGRKVWSLLQLGEKGNGMK